MANPEGRLLPSRSTDTFAPFASRHIRIASLSRHCWSPLLVAIVGRHLTQGGLTIIVAHKVNLKTPALARGFFNSRLT
jgi:hypothetical protein